MVEHNLAVWVQFPRRHQKGVARRTRILAVRGLSAKVGEALALDLSDPSLTDIAKAMYASIRCKRESSSLTANSLVAIAAL